MTNMIGLLTSKPQINTYKTSLGVHDIQKTPEFVAFEKIPKEKNIEHVLSLLPTSCVFHKEESIENETIFVRKHTKGESILVIDTDGDFMVSFASYEHPSLGWRFFYDAQDVNLQQIANRFLSEE